jgi:hypothetical protein
MLCINDETQITRLFGKFSKYDLVFLDQICNTQGKTNTKET